MAEKAGCEHCVCEKNESKGDKAILGYWKIRGLAQAIRLLLEYTKTPYEEALYEGDKRQQWMEVKPKLGLTFPNLPYYIDGKFKLTESNAILHYIGAKHKLCGSTIEESAMIDMILGHAYDWRQSVSRLVYNPANKSNFEELKANFFKDEYSRYLQDFEDFIGNKKFIMGENITIADFVVYEILDVAQIMFPTCLNSAPNLKKYTATIEAIDQIAQYVKTSRYIKRPINNINALFY